MSQITKYLSAIGRKGGRVKSQAKTESARKANAARWKSAKCVSEILPTISDKNEAKMWREIATELAENGGGLGRYSAGKYLDAIEKYKRAAATPNIRS